MNDVVSRFIRYARTYTESDPYGAPGTPSTPRQFDLARMLVEEMRAMGIDNAFVDGNCYVYGKLPATPGCEDLPAIGLIAHMDTTPDMTGKDVKPQVIRYEGGPLALGHGVEMTPEEFPDLARYAGQELICADGTTLLGADDKAGVAIILQAAEELLAEGAPHGPVCLAFTPDEEIGRGASNFDLEGFGADFAFTVDGGAIDEYEYETFNAAQAVVTVNGFSIHPGTSKGKMRNALLIAMELNGLLPALETPRHTEGYEGFFHLVEMSGKCEQARMVYILRDHDHARFEERKALLAKAAAEIDRRWGAGTIDLSMADQYQNMVEVLKDRPEILALAEAAMKAGGVERPVHPPVRGGTDGCMLTFMGLPCPNLPTGGHYAHGRFEFVPVPSLLTGVKIVKSLLEPARVRTAMAGRKEA